MTDIREYIRLFETGLVGKLYIISGFEDNRKAVFRIFVVPNGDPKFFTEDLVPTDVECVEVFGVVEIKHNGGSLMTEPIKKYGWLHEGPWQEDFQGFLDGRLAVEKLRIAEKEEEDKRLASEREERTKRILSEY